MKLFAILCLSLFQTLNAFADELSIVDVRRNIPLSDDEPAYKDFYLAGDKVSSLKKNLVVTATRRQSIRDSKGSQAYGEIEVPVGQLRILAVYGRVAVAREYKILSRDDHPMLEQTGMMSGDLIDLTGSFTDAKPLPKPKKVSEVETPADEGRSTASVSGATAMTNPPPVVVPTEVAPAAAANEKATPAPPNESPVSAKPVEIPAGLPPGVPAELAKAPSGPSAPGVAEKTN